MERKTIAYYRNIISKGFNANAVREVIEKYGYKSGDFVKIYLGHDFTPFHWNHRIEGFFLNTRTGKLYADIYWQGDSTDGNNSVNVADFNYRNEVVIPAEHEWLGDRTYCRHSDIRVSREELTEANTALIAWLSPEEVKRRKEAELKNECHKRVHNYTGNELYKQYAGSIWSTDEKWFNGIHAVDEYINLNYKALAKLDEPKLREVIKAVFLANYKYDRNMPKGESESRFCKAPIIYDLSYAIV